MNQPSSIEMFLPLIIMVGIFYFLIIRPQGKRMRDHDKFLTGLKKGDAVVTASGILGVIDGMTEAVVTLDVSNGVKIKILRKQIAGPQAQALETKK